MTKTGRATASAVPPTADIVGHRGHVRKVPIPEVGAAIDHLVGTTNQAEVAVAPWVDHTRPAEEKTGGFSAALPGHFAFNYRFSGRGRKTSVGLRATVRHVPNLPKGDVAG
jgi:hypothetical protein